VSEATAQKIDAEVRRFVEAGHMEARRILKDHADDLETLAQGLLEYETLSGDEIKDLLKGTPPKRDSGDEPPLRSSSIVPTAGKGRSSRDNPDAGMEPQPQA
jgi:cell division protease FtsH